MITLIKNMFISSNDNQDNTIQDTFIMQIKTHITPINLNLRYDCIYYFPSRTDKSLNTKMMEAVDGWRCSFYPEMILVKNYPKVKFQYVPDEDLSKLYDTASGNDENGEYARRLLEEVCGNEDGGVLVSRLYSKDAGDDVELFVSSDLLSGCDYVNGILNDFALEIAKENFERITGKSYSTYKAYEDNNRGGSSTEFITIDSRKYQQESRYESRIEQQLREKTSKFSSLSEYNSMEDILEDLKKLCSEIEDGKKLTKKHKIVVESFNDTADIEIFVIVNNDKRIRCEFERGIIGKVFYIFFLRHPQGGDLYDLTKCLDELLELYEKFDLTGRNYENEEAEKNNRRKSLENMLTKETMAQYRSYVKKSFNEIFCTGIASEYCININKSKMSIPLDRKYVDLGGFEK